MDNETEVTPTAEAEPVAIEDQEPPQTETEAETEAPVETDGLDDLLKEAIGSEEETPDDLLDVEYEGETFKLPPKLKDALLRQSDYTRKTMEVAEQRKAVEALKSEIETVHRATNEEFQAAVTLQALDARIASYQSLDTTGWSQEDINAARIDYNELMQERGQIQQALSYHVNERMNQESVKNAKLREEAISGAARHVPNFNDTRRAELESLAVAFGIPKEDAETIIHPGVYGILHYADIGKKFTEQRRQSAKAKAAQAGKPAATVGGAAEAVKSTQDMSMDEYIAARNAGKI